MLIAIHLVAGFRWTQDAKAIYAEEHIYLKYLHDVHDENAIWKEAEFLAAEYRKTPRPISGVDSGFPALSELNFVDCDVRCVGKRHDLSASLSRIAGAVRISTFRYRFQSLQDFEQYIAGNAGKNELPVQILSL
ncbi:MAG: hypothetical protein ABJG15_03945 [Hyphomonadaceae bacterium]